VRRHTPVVDASPGRRPSSPCRRSGRGLPHGSALVDLDDSVDAR